MRKSYFWITVLLSPFLSGTTCGESPGPRPQDWFHSPAVTIHGGQTLFAEKDQPVRWAFWSCWKLPRKEKLGSWTALLKKRAGFSGQIPFPRSVHIEDLSQFWKEGEDYHQLSMAWQQDFPPTYQLHHFVSKDARLESQVRSLEIPGYATQSYVDSESALSLVEQLLRVARTHKAEEGARMMLVASTERLADGTEKTHRAEYLNGNASRYWDDFVSCAPSADQTYIQCRCTNGKEKPHD